MDYPCSKFGECSFNRSGFIVRTVPDKQTDVDGCHDSHVKIKVNVDLYSASS